MIRLPGNAQSVIDTVKKAGHVAYAVGGSVRDTLMNRPTHGWDYTTDAKPEEILALFPDSFYDNQFGTVGIKIRKPGEFTPEGDPVLEDIFEITTFRSEKEYSDYRHPDNLEWGTSLEADLSRRDFTINAIATDGTEIIDPYNGQEDLKAGLIRTVGDPDKRFAEDALRMMRAVRIASQLGFSIDPQTLLAMQRNSGLITRISRERVRDELLKILSSGYPSDGIMMLKTTGILSHVIPELNDAFGIEQKSPGRHHIYDVGTHSVMALKFCPSSDPIVRLATLLHDIGKPRTFRRDETGTITFYNHEVVGMKVARDIAQRLRLSNKQTDKVLTLIRWHQFSVDERQTDSAIRRIIRRVGKENLDDMLALRIGDRLGGGARETSWRLELFKRRLEEVQKQPFSVKDLKVNGYDVMTVFGCKPGRIIGDTLDALFALVEEGSLSNDRDTLMAKLAEMKSNPHPGTKQSGGVQEDENTA